MLLSWLEEFDKDKGAESAVGESDIRPRLSWAVFGFKEGAATGPFVFSTTGLSPEGTAPISICSLPAVAADPLKVDREELSDGESISFCASGVPSGSFGTEVCNEEGPVGKGVEYGALAPSVSASKRWARLEGALTIGAESVLAATGGCSWN